MQICRRRDGTRHRPWTRPCLRNGYGDTLGAQHPPNKTPTPSDAHRHVDRVGGDETRRAKITDPEQEVGGGDEAGAEGEHPGRLGAELAGRGGGGDEGFEDAVDGEEGDVVAVGAQDGAGRGGGPSGAGDGAEEERSQGRGDGEEEEGEEGIESEDGEEIGVC